MAACRKIVIAILGLAALLAGAAPAGATGRPLATVGDVTISDEDVAFRQRVAPVAGTAHATPDQTRLATLRQLLIEAAGANSAAADLRANPDLQRGADMQRRQSLLSLYDSRKVSRVSVSDADIDSFIAGHPQFFGNRKTWHFHEASIHAKLSGGVALMTTSIGALRNLTAVAPEQVAGLLAWAQGDGYETALTNRWLGTEQIEAATYAQLAGMAASGRQILAECSGDTCHVLLLHGGYDDRVDPQFLREAVRRNLISQKQIALAETINTALLARTPIVFHDAVLARDASKAWNRPKVLSAPTGLRLLWVTQALALFAALGWAALQLLRGHLRVGFGIRRPRWAPGVSEAAIAFLGGRGVQLALAASVSVATSAGAIRVFSITGFADYTQDMVIIAGFVALGVVMMVVPYRYSPTCRTMMERQIGPVAIIAALQAFLLLVAG